MSESACQLQADVKSETGVFLDSFWVINKFILNLKTKAKRFLKRKYQMKPGKRSKQRNKTKVP